jgi:hypothetical protein
MHDRELIRGLLIVLMESMSLNSQLIAMLSTCQPGGLSPEQQAALETATAKLAANKAAIDAAVSANPIPT